MADRPQVPGWDNKNLNKPDEYSSEFAVDGNIYANVTNVTTGQRQLYLVSGVKTGFTGSLFTQRTLISTTNADGTVQKGEGYDDFIRAYGIPKLTNAEINNRRQANFIISKTSNSQELQTLGKTPQYKSSLTNVSSVGIASTSEQTTDQVIAELQERVSKNAKIRKKYGEDHRYPININDKQDCIKFTMYGYVPKKFNSTIVADTNNDGSGQLFSELKARENFGSVILPIHSPITDTNTVSWGDNNMNVFEANAAALALQLITGAPPSGDKTTENISDSAGAIASLVGITLAGKAATGQSGSGLFTRLTGGIINPNLELLFNGPVLRSFSFVFKMSAREEKESEQIRNIIRFFKQGMSVKRAESNLFLISPNMFDISYLYRGGKSAVKHPWMNRIKTCALQSCSVNYTPDGTYSTYSDGAMTCYELTLSFGELTPIYDDDYDAIDNSQPPAPFKEIGY